MPFFTKTFWNLPAPRLHFIPAGSHHLTCCLSHFLTPLHTFLPQCVALLKADPDNEEGAIMLAELMFHKEHYDTAIYHFTQVSLPCGVQRFAHGVAPRDDLLGRWRGRGRSTSATPPQQRVMRAHMCTHAQLLERKPGHWGALSQLIGLLRRAGRLEDVPK